MAIQRVLVTGGSGFIAGHCIIELLKNGYMVQATLRSLAKEAAVRAALADAGMVKHDRLRFIAADLKYDEGWARAAADVDHVMHVASPVQPGYVANEADVITPAVDGTLRVLRAARRAGVRRVVMTSAFHAVGWGHPRSDRTFTEQDWTVVDGPGVDAYGKSKTLAERAAWDFVEREGDGLELTTMLPVAVIGPVIGKDISGANQLVQRMLAGGMPGFPNLFIPVVDVRDVASAHILALAHPLAGGQRFMLSNGRALSMKEIGDILKRHLGQEAIRVPTRTIPDVLLRVMAVFNTELRPLLPELGYARTTSSEHVRRVFGWNPRDPSESILAAAKSLLDNKLIKV